MNHSKTVEGLSSALVQLAKEENKVKELQIDLTNLKSFMESDDSFKQFLNKSNLDKPQKIQDLMSLNNIFQFSGTLNMIGMLVQANACNLLSYVIKASLYQTEEELGVVHMNIYAPFELSVEQIKTLENAILAKKNLLPDNFQELDTKFSVDSSLIGGIKITLNSKVIDNSYLAKLQETRNNSLNKKGN